MKNKGTLILLLLTTTTIFSQEKRQQFIGGGIGVSYANLRGENAIPIFDHAWKLNMTYNLTYDFFLKNKWGLGAEVKYLNIGSNYKDEPGDGRNDFYAGKVDLITELNYISVPLTIKYKLIDTRLIFKAGVYASLLLSGRLEGNPKGYFDDTLSYNQDLALNIAQWDAGLTYGLESNLPIGDQILFSMNATFNNGLVPLKMESDRQVKNDYFSFLVGLKYAIK